MKTVDEVFELIEIREDASDAVLSWRIGPAWKLTEAEKVYVEATKNLRTAIEELHRDAARHKFVVKSPIHAVCEWNPPRQMGCTGWYELDEEQLDAAMEAT